MNATRDEIQQYILTRLVELSQDWDDPREVSPESLLFTQLGFESLDAVILGVTIQGHFECEMPFSELFAELGEHKRDLPVKELIDFVHQNLLKCAARSESPKLAV